VLTSRWTEDYTRLTKDAAKKIGQLNIEVDGGILGGGTGWAPWGEQGRHFDRLPGPEDSRLESKDEELRNAVRICSENGDPDEAAEHLALALHSVQDYWAHGQFSEGTADTLIAHLERYDVWNPGWDAQTGDGRAPRVMQEITIGDVPGMPPVTNTLELRYTDWVRGTKRRYGTQADTLVVLFAFKNTKGDWGCRCQAFFLPEYRNRWAR